MGLDAAAKAGIVHRDIKPQNIFLAGGILAGSTPMHCKILDFGVARAMNQGATLTKGSSLLGTPAYMAPEQARGESVDHRTDLHALTAVLYRAATGLPPFAGDTAMAVMLSVVSDMPAKGSDVGLPERFDPFFAKGFAKNASERFQSGAELSAAFAEVCNLQGQN
jgi:serine/threonine protein kinase